MPCILPSLRLTRGGYRVRLIFCLGLASFASSVSLRALDPMLPVVAADLQVTLARAALLASAYSFPYALMQVVLGPAADAVGKVKLICLSLAGVVLGSTICAVASGFESVLAGRIVAGGCAGGIIPVAFALIGDRVPYAERHLALSRVLIISIAGHMTGGAGSGVLAAAFGWRSVFAVAALIAAASLVVVFAFLRGEEDVARVRPTFLSAFIAYAAVLTDPLALVVVGAVMAEGVLFFGIFPFMAPLLELHGSGGGSLAAGMALAAFALGGGVYGVVARRIFARLGQFGMLRFGGLVAGLIYLMTAVPLPWMVICGLFLVAGFGFYNMHNTLQLRATELAPATRASAVALFAAAFFLGQGVGPLLGGMIGDAIGFTVLYAAAGVLIVGLGFATAHGVKRIDAERSVGV
jgi:predicted MFS family arabinose efflux permease